MENKELLDKIEAIFHIQVNAGKVPRTCIMSTKNYREIQKYTYLYMDLYYSDLINDTQIFVSDTQILRIAVRNYHFRRLSDYAAMNILAAVSSL